MKITSYWNETLTDPSGNWKMESICHFKHCCCKPSLLQVLLHVCLSKDCWIQPQVSPVSAPAAPRGCDTQWASSWYVLGWKTIFLGIYNVYLSSPSLTSSLKCRFDLSTSILPQPCNEAVLETVGALWLVDTKGEAAPRKSILPQSSLKWKASNIYSCCQS